MPVIGELIKKAIELGGKLSSEDSPEKAQAKV